jgi:hypothetical protein
MDCAGCCCGCSHFSGERLREWRRVERGRWGLVDASHVDANDLSRGYGTDDDGLTATGAHGAMTLAKRWRPVRDGSAALAVWLRSHGEFER